ncbi:MAG: hypothetical protein DRJ97_07515 [Thermoprotei archaeon]|nr:MAG: hypothetical protein DRJ69_02950 [Thermoprotei archaeon]RLF13736.1 MAG: hypothetical protein DRJ97_07515 [Thermoprotei archaeon]
MGFLAQWMPVPLEEIIVDLLRRRGGVVKDRELLTMLKAMLGDVSQRELIKALLKLELHDVVRVSNIKKNLRSVTLVKQEGG